ncbi:metal-dependent phosphohydrolase [Candidatus Berkelbacteria bacterium CG10_big_fil_rev_8_21_14_0_10_43_13]|uniref:Metal-dependent phosphohydrolase n=1 Tax=Candidatus Berkelbacteria bacterium CG10_big_fil_rev_8_21_14_0_10_43_13 TaxID=1974514 RepID=A0A2H0W6P4_9BACT|nr:MAG: metal-dependent phosphohydrolase [Candidatus Berkelbacteria bacterium CG10_big_fil_rev_8_21_14_0_10_43_13]
MNIVKKVKDYVEAECLKSTSKYGFEIFEFHFAVVVKYAQILADELGADREVVTLAGWLHDIGSVLYGLKDHHLTGAKIAEEKLREFNYPKNKIRLVKNCILHHRGSTASARRTLEEKIVAEADTMTAFDSIGGLFKAAYIFENLHQAEAEKSVLKKLENKYKKLHFAKSKEIIKPKYEAAKLLLKK